MLNLMYISRKYYGERLKMCENLQKTERKQRKAPLFFFAFFFCVFFLGVKGEAAPLADVPTVLCQPDGSRIDCFSSGDEHFNYLHDRNGALIVQDEKGWYVYAENCEGRPVPSSEPVRGRGVLRASGSTGRMTADQVDLERNADLAAEFSYETGRFLDPDRKKQEAEPAAYGLRSAPQAQDRLTNLVVFVRFQGEEEFVSGAPGKPTAAIPKTEQSGGAEALELSDSYAQVSRYFEKVSGGSFTADTVFLTADPNGDTMLSYEDAHPRSYYQEYSASNPNGYHISSEDGEADERTMRELTLLENALRASLPSLPGDVLLDRNGDGKIDNITFLVSGTTSGWNQILWPHSWGLKKDIITVKDASGEEKQAYDFNLTFSSVQYAGTGVLAHELLHTVGFPDLYRYQSGSGTPVGGWDVMGTTDYTDPQFPGAYLSENYAGWGNVEEIPGSGVYTLYPLGTENGSPSGYRVPTGNPNEFIVAEYRKNGAAQDVTQDNVPRDGLLLYRVDKVTSQGNRNGLPDAGGDEVYIFRPGDSSVNAGTQGRLKEAALSGRWNAASYGSASSSVPAKQTLYFHNGRNSRITVSEVEENSDGTVSFRVTLPEDACTAEPGTACDLSKSDWTVSKPGEYRISGTSSQHGITVTGGVKGVKLILESTSADLSASEYRSPIALRGGSQAEIVLRGECALRGGKYAPAVSVGEKASLVVSGPGRLSAFGGSGAAALGGSAFEPAGSLAFSGTEVSAVGGGPYTVQGAVFQLKGSAAAAVGGGAGQPCGDICLMDTVLSAVSESGCAVSSCPPDGADGGNIEITGGSVQAQGVLYAGASLSCRDAELSVVQKTADRALGGQAPRFACLDAAKTIRLDGCTVELEAGEGGSAVGSRDRLPRVELLGGSLSAASQDYTVCCSSAAVDDQAELFLASGETEIFYSGSFPGTEIPVPVQLGMPAGASGRAAVLQGTLNSPLPAQDVFRLEAAQGGWEARRMVPEGTRTAAFSLPGTGTYRLLRTGGASAKEADVAADGITRIAPLEFFYRTPEYRVLDLSSGEAEITESGEYLLRGNVSGGSVTAAGGLDVILHLDGAALEAPSGKAAVSAGAETALTLVLEENSENRLSGASGCSAVRAEGPLTILGGGSLSAFGGGTAPALSAADVSLGADCRVLAASGGEQAVQRRKAKPEDAWGTAEETPVLLLGSFEKKFSGETEVFFRGGEAADSCFLPKGTVSFFRTLSAKGTRTITTGSNTASQPLACPEDVNDYQDIVLTAWNRESQACDLNAGNVRIAENGVYVVSGATDRHTITVEDGVTATLILDGVRMRITKQEFLEDKLGLIELGRDAAVTLSFPSSKEASSLLNLVPGSGCGVAYVPRSSRLTVEGGQTLTAEPGESGALFGTSADVPAGEIVLRSGEIDCKLNEDSSSEILVGGNLARVLVENGSLTVSGGPCGAVGGANSRVEVNGGALSLSGGVPEGTLGGSLAAVEITGGTVSLSLLDGCIGVGGNSAAVEIRGGSVQVSDMGTLTGGMLAGVGGPYSRVRAGGGEITVDTARRSGTDRGALGGTDARLEFTGEARAAVRMKQRECAPLAGNVLEQSVLSGGFVEAKLHSAFSSASEIRLETLEDSREVRGFSLPAQYYGFFLYAPEGVYNVCGPQGGCAGAAEVRAGEVDSLGEVGFDRLPGVWLADKTETFDQRVHQLTVSGTLPPDADVAYEGNSASVPGVYPVTAVITHPGGSYTLSAGLTLAKAPLTVTGAAAADKPVYDGTCRTSGSVLFRGTVGELEPEVTAEFSFETPDVGVDKPVQVSHAALSPEWEKYYELVVPAGALDGVTASVAAKARAQVMLEPGSLLQPEGAAKAPKTVTVPAGLPCRITYNGAGTLPQAAGIYQVRAMIDDPNYEGPEAVGTLELGAALDLSGGDVRITAPGTYTVTGETEHGRIVVDCGGLEGEVSLCLRDVSVDLRKTGGIPLEVLGAPQGGVAVTLPENSRSVLWGGDGEPAVASASPLEFRGRGTLQANGGRNAEAADLPQAPMCSGRVFLFFCGERREGSGAQAGVSFSFAAPAEEDLGFSLVSEQEEASFILPKGAQTAEIFCPLGPESPRYFLRNAAGEDLWCLTEDSRTAYGLPFSMQDLPERVLDLAEQSPASVRENGVYRLLHSSGGKSETVMLDENVCAVLVLDGSTFRNQVSDLALAGSGYHSAVVVCESDAVVEPQNGGFSQCDTLRIEGPGKLTLLPGAGGGSEPEIRNRQTVVSGDLEITLGDAGLAFDEGAVAVAEGGKLTVRAEGNGSVVFPEEVRFSAVGGTVSLELSGEHAVGFGGGETVLSQGASVRMEVTGKGARGLELPGGVFRAELDETSSFGAWTAGEDAACIFGGSAVSQTGSALFCGTMPDSGYAVPAGGAVLTAESGALPGWRQRLYLPENAGTVRSFLMLLPHAGEYAFTLGGGGHDLTAEASVGQGVSQAALAFELLADLPEMVLEDLTCVYDGTEKTVALENVPAGAQVRYENNTGTEPGEYRVKAAVQRPGFRLASLSALLTIEKRPLTVTVSAEDKEVYDGTAAVKGTVRLGNAVGGDLPEATAEFTLDTPDVGQDKRVTVSRITLVEDENHWPARYCLTQDTAETTASVKHKAEVSVAFDPETLIQEYGSVSAPAVCVPEGLAVALSYDGREGLPALPGSCEVTARVEDQNFQGAAQGVFTVLPKQLSLSGVRVPSIREDAESPVLTVTDSGDFDAAASGVVEGDRVFVSYTAEYPDLAPGQKTVELTEAALSGPQADRYELTGTAWQGSGEVTRKSGEGGGAPPPDPGPSDESQEPEAPSEPEEPGLPVGDIETHWAREDILYLYEQGLMEGAGDGSFEPEGRMTRAMLVTVLCRMAGGDPDAYPGSGYGDVPENSWYAPYVQWASEEGITQGMEGGLFQPNASVSREQIAVFLYRYAQSHGKDTALSGTVREFPDQSRISDWAEEAIDWAVDQGILGGRDTGMLDPLMSATRAEVSAMVRRYLAWAGAE